MLTVRIITNPIFHAKILQSGTPRPGENNLEAGDRGCFWLSSCIASAVQVSGKLRVHVIDADTFQHSLCGSCRLESSCTLWKRARESHFPAPAVT